MSRSNNHIRAIVRCKIVNDESQAAIFAAHIMSTSIRKEDHGYVEYSNQDSGFFGILGTPNGGTIARMITDHKNDMEYRIIDKIVVLGQEGLKFGGSETINIVVMLRKELK